MILAIESAIAGGSVSFLQGASAFASWKGDSDVSRAEDLLPAISALMSENGVARNDLSLIAVSAGPGSFTGIRIGVSTAIGLGTGLRIEVASASILKAMASAARSENVMAAVPMGRSAICIQSFDASKDELRPLTEPATITEIEFTQLAAAAPGELVIHGALAKFCKERSVLDLGFDLATVLGKYCHQHPNEREKPLFISKSF